MFQPVIITLVFHPLDARSGEIMQAFVNHFNKLGMQRARVPVHVRCEPLYADGRLQPIASTADKFDVVVVLYGLEIGEEPGPWIDLCRDAEGGMAADQLLSIVVQLDEDIAPFGAFQACQQVKWWDWQDIDASARAVRLMIHVVNAIRRKLAGTPKIREHIFVSHAKIDARAAAKAIIKHVNDPDNGLRLSTFYDELHLETGEDWKLGLHNGVRDGTVLGLISDAYDSRPWCNQEILWAKEYRRPILFVDIGSKRIDRSFPYAGNATLIKVAILDASEIQRVLLELLSEGLRCDLFKVAADAATGGGAIVLPRPPELADLAFLQAGHGNEPVVYPDPPLSDTETELLEKLAGGRRIVALSEYS